MNMSPTVNWNEILPQELRILYQKDWDRYREKFGVPFARGTIANLLSKGLGPKSFILAGRRAFHREDIIAFLDDVTIKSHRVA